MQSKIFFRTDGSAEIGLGHIIRCLALAKILKDDFSIIFVSKRIPEKLKEELSDNNFDSKVISTEEDFFLMLSGKEIVVLDHYGLDSIYQKRIKDVGSKLVCIDDLHNKKFYADLIINHSPVIHESDYDAEDYTKYALGVKFALLRPAFLKAAQEARTVKNIENLLICFGGSDFNNLTKSVLEVVHNINSFNKVTVILGSAYPYRETLSEIIKKIPNLRLLSSLDENNMLSEIRAADLAIIPSSGILFEVIAAGTIPLICYYAENQRKLFNYFKQKEDLPFFNALEFNAEELITVITHTLNKKNKMNEIPLRQEIKNSSSNHLNNFKQLING